jgi:nucleoside-diphosphate-sugar epimerase
LRAFFQVHWFLAAAVITFATTVDLCRLAAGILLVNRFPIGEHGRRVGSVERRCPNTNKLRLLAGFEAQVGLQEGLQTTMEWYDSGMTAPVTQ